MAKILFKHSVLCLHFIVVAVLIGITSWDIWNIVDDYNTENVLTVVKPEVSNSTFRHLEGERIRYDLNNINPSIVPEYWFMTIGPVPVCSIMPCNNASILISDPNYFLQKSSSSLSDLDFLAIAMLFDQIACLDSVQKDYIGKPGFSYSGNQQLLCKNISNIDGFLKNTTLIKGLQEILWNHIRSSLIRTEFDNLPPSAIPLISLRNTSAYIEIDPSQLLNTQNTRIRLLIGHIADLNLMMNATEYRSPSESIYIRTQPYTTDLLSINYQTGAQISMNIANTGIFDKSRTTKCTYDPIVHIRDETIGQWKMTECDVYQYLSKTPEVCHCVPFTYRKSLEKLAVYQNYKDLPFCTDGMYQNCGTELRVSMNQAKTSCPQQCITVKNQYQFTVKSGISQPVMRFQQPTKSAFGAAATLDIECRDTAYVLYLERYQLTIFQLISQIGGDIGLYTGISMFGIWQLILVIYLWCHKEKGQKPASEETRNRWSFMDMLIRESGLNFSLKGEQAEIQISTNNPNIANGTAYHEEHFNVIFARLEKMEQEFGRVNENLLKDQVSKWMEQAFDGHMQKFTSQGQESDGVTRRRNISQHPNAVEEDIYQGIG